MANINTAMAENKDEELVYFLSKFWWGFFMGSSILVSILLLIVVAYPLNLSVASDAVFGALALASGIIVNLILKMKFKKTMIISEKIPFSILYAWVPLCLYVMVFRPFE